MSNLYTTQVIAATNTGSFAESYTVPTGFVLSVVDINVQVTPDPTVVSNTDVRVVVAGGNVLFDVQVTPIRPRSVTWRGRCALNADDTITVFLNGAGGMTASVVVTGYLLQAP